MGARESRMDHPRAQYLVAESKQIPGSSGEPLNFCSFDRGSTWRDILTPGLLEYIPSHWTQFEPPSPCTHFMLAVLYCIIFVVGCGGNGVVIFMYLKSKKLRSPSNFLLFNLAICDFIMLAKTPVFIYNSYYCGPAYGNKGCEIYGFLGGLTGNGAILTTAFAAVDRYNVISNPLNPKRLTNTTATLAVLFIWAYSLLFSVLPLLKIYNRFTYEGYLTSCTVDYLEEGSRSYVIVYWVFAWCIPVAVIVSSYWGIVKAVGHSERTLRRMEDSTSAVKDAKKGQREEIAIAKTAATLIGLWLVSWTPYAVVALIGAFGRPDLIHPSWSVIPALTAKTAATIDPFVYSLSHPKFKKEFAAVFCKPSDPKPDDTITIESKY